jgi:hypothetical protein
MGLGAAGHMSAPDLASARSRTLWGIWWPWTRLQLWAAPGVEWHVVAPGLALEKRAAPVTVGFVLVLELSRYLGVLVPRGTDTHLTHV